LFDLLDERPLTRGEARSFCCLIFGVENENELPDPAIDLKSFLKAVDERLLGERMQWNPVKKVKKILRMIMLFLVGDTPQCWYILSCEKKMTPWILTKALGRSLSKKSRCIIM
jgi:hypothetical protein